MSNWNGAVIAAAGLTHHCLARPGPARPANVIRRDSGTHFMLGASEGGEGFSMGAIVFLLLVVTRFLRAQPRQVG
jgi:hypothetical protein